MPIPKSGLPPARHLIHPSLVFHCGLLFCFVVCFFSLGCLLNKCTQLICRAMFSSHPAAPHLSELPGIPPTMQLLRVSGNYRRQRLLLLDKRLSFPLVPHSTAVRIKSISRTRLGGNESSLGRVR